MLIYSLGNKWKIAHVQFFEFEPLYLHKKILEVFRATGDIGLLYVLGVNGQILMHFAAFLGVEWFDYLDKMRDGIKDHGAVRDGVYAMTGGGKSFTTEEEGR